MKTKTSKKLILFLIPIVLLMIISLLNLYYAPNLSSLYKSFFKKQIIWYSLSFGFFIAILLIKPKIILKLFRIEHKKQKIVNKTVKKGVCQTCGEVFDIE